MLCIVYSGQFRVTQGRIDVFFSSRHTMLSDIMTPLQGIDENLRFSYEWYTFKWNEHV